MAKVATKKKPTNNKPGLGVANTDELLADSANPRCIQDKAANGLRQSLKRFGDLSGIVFNRATGELVTGHQRMAQIRDEYGDQKIELLDVKAELGIIRINEQDGVTFSVRVVNWDRKKQRAANVVANSQKIAGRFDDTLGDYLLSVEEEITAEDPAMFEDLMLDELLLATQAVAVRKDEEESNKNGLANTVTFDVLVSGKTSLEQTEICALMTQHEFDWEIQGD